MGKKRSEKRAEITVMSWRPERGELDAGSDSGDEKKKRVLTGTYPGTSRSVRRARSGCRDAGRKLAPFCSGRKPGQAWGLGALGLNPASRLVWLGGSSRRVGRSSARTCPPSMLHARSTVTMRPRKQLPVIAAACRPMNWAIFSFHLAWFLVWVVGHQRSLRIFWILQYGLARLQDKVTNPRNCGRWL